MIGQIDLNADLGESFGPWPMGADAEVLGAITSANIACGFHAGDADVMMKTMRLAVQNGVGIGAHPGYADLQGFGRHRMQVPRATLQNQIRYQVGAAQAMARAAGGQVRHLKLHGALANTAAEDFELATALYDAALSVAPDIAIMVLAATEQQAAAAALGCTFVCEIFADRAYNDDATLVDRTIPGAVIHDADLAGKRITDMVLRRAIVTASGKEIPTRIDTICLHGDTPEAVDIARAVRRDLEAAGVTVTRFPV
jgi:UPF0271 protein